MPVPWYRSIRTQVLLLLTAPLLLLFWLLVVHTKQVFEQVQVENLVQSVTTYSQTLNLGISVHLGIGNSVQQLAPFLNEFIGSDVDGIDYLALTDEQGELIAKTPETPVLATVAANLPMTPELLSLDQYHVSIPILLEGDNVGLLHYGVSLNSIRQASQSVFQRFLGRSLLGLGLIVILISTLAIWGLLRISRRLQGLIQRSRKIAKGDYSVPIVDNRRDEIGVLGHQMERMREAIRNRIAESNESRLQVEQLNRNLVETLEQLRVSQVNLVQSEKLASLGGIVAAVAHELNTPVGNALTVATTFDQKAQEFSRALAQGLKKSILEKYVSDSILATELITRNLTRASDLVESFKHVAVDQTSSKRRWFNLSDTMEDLLTTLRPTIKHRPVTIHVDIPDDIEMDSFPGPLCQVVSNLFNNSMVHAFESSDTDGTWDITARMATAEQVTLRVTDNGTGMPEAIVNKIFDPFFTTRLGQGGSGLGLHIVYNLVTSVLGGTVSVDSEPDRGSTFILQLPLSPQTLNDNTPEQPVTA